MPRFKNPKEIKVGVVGYGGAFNMGRKHLEEMKRAGMTPTAVCEIDETRLKVALADFPEIETYTTVEKMLQLSNVNLITIITPHNTHARLALKCLKAGRHVVCEKPLAITTEECDAMIKAAKKKKLVLSTYHNRHWDGWILDGVKNIVRKKVIGTVFRIEAHMGSFGQPGDWWRSSKSISGGILYDWGVHLLEYCLQIIDSDIVEVSGFATTGVWDTKWKEDTNESDASAIVRFKNGAFIHLNISNLASMQKPGKLIFTGTKGTYVMDFGSYEIIKHEDGVKTSTIQKNGEGKGHLFYKNIANHMTKGEKLIITPEWSRRPIHILDLANKSAKKGITLKAKYK